MVAGMLMGIGFLSSAAAAGPAGRTQGDPARTEKESPGAPMARN